MKFNDCPLRNELKEGLLQYERDTNISPFSLIESLIEEFLYKNEYLVVGVGDKEVPFPAELNQTRIKYARPRKNGHVQIRKQINGRVENFGNCCYSDAEILIKFLESKNWDIKYSTKKTKLRGKKQIDFLFNEIEKEKKVRYH